MEKRIAQVFKKWSMPISFTFCLILSSHQTMGKENKMQKSEASSGSKVLVIWSRNEDRLKRKELGRVVFDVQNKPTLILGSAPPQEADRLQKVWTEITKKKTLTHKYHKPIDKNGNLINVLVGKEVSPGDPEYIYALERYLSNNGFGVEMVVEK